MTRNDGSRVPQDRRSRFRLWRCALAIAPLTLLVCLVTTTAASASSVSAVTAAANPSNTGAAATYTISYTPATDQTYLGTISVEAAPGTTFTACSSSCSGYTLVQGGTEQSISSVSVQATSGSSTTNEFVITLGFGTIDGGTSVTILAPGKNPTTSGTDTLHVWTSADTTPVSVSYTIGTPAGGLVQGAVPNAGASPVLTLDSPGYLQTLFGTPTDTIPTLGTDYLPSDTWADMDGVDGSLSYLSDWAIPGYQLVLGVPIIPSQESGASLADGASSNPDVNYDSYFNQLAKTLVSENLGNAWLRLGYEFDNDTSGNAWETGNSQPQEQNFALFFQNIVTTMRAVPGANFKYIWNPDAYAFDGGAEDTVYPGYNVSLAWPGASYVNYIGVDLYDYAPAPGYTPTEEWNWILPQLTSTNSDALGAEAFAAKYDVPLAFPEWGVAAPESGLYGLGDDPNYINQMYCVMTNPDNNVAWESYSNTSYDNWNTEITGGSFPNSLAAFQADFGKSGTPYNCSG